MSAARRWWPFGVVTVVVMALAVVEVLPRWSGLAHLVGVPPLDLLADARILVAEATSPLTFAVGAVAAIVVRASVLALLLAGVLGGARRALGFAFAFYLAAAVPAFVAAALDFTGRAVLYAYLGWAGLAVTVLTFVMLAAAPWTGAPTLRAAISAAFGARLRFAPLLAYGGGLSLLTILVPRSGDWTIVAVPASAALTLVTVQRLSTEPESRLDLELIAPIVTTVVLVLSAFTAVATEDGERPSPPALRGSLLLVPGVDTDSGRGSLYELDPSWLGFSCRQTFYFSYAGAGQGSPQRRSECPIRSGAPYEARDTLRPLDELRRAFAAQVRDLPAPVVVITHSQGAWIAWDAIAGGEAPNVDALVMLAPFAETLVAYPAEGEHGQGVVGGAAARAITAFGRDIDFNEYDPDRPLPRALQATPGAAEALFAAELPGEVRALAVRSRWDLALQLGRAPAGARDACPGWATHGGLPQSVDSLTAVARFLRERDHGGCPPWTRAVAKVLASVGAPPPK